MAPDKLALAEAEYAAFDPGPSGRVGFLRQPLVALGHLGLDLRITDEAGHVCEITWPS